MSPATRLSTPALPPGLTLFERGWLSANNALFVGADSTVLVDSGYCTHSAQTLALVGSRLGGGRPLDLLVNTHLHSDHCGGNAALQAAYPSLRTLIPPGEARAVRDWDEAALSYAPTGQQCPRFSFDDVLRPGATLRLAGAGWQVHAAPGHDPNSLILFEPASRTLISADALWHNGFGVVFPEVAGKAGFDEVAATLDLIESLGAARVIPGHGAAFEDVDAAISRARSRLDGFVRDPKRHAAHAARVLLKFRLLQWRRVPLGDFLDWAARVPYLGTLHGRYFEAQPQRQWLAALADDLVRVGAAGRDAAVLFDRG